MDLLANTTDGSERPTPVASWTDKDVCQRPSAITFGPHPKPSGVVRFEASLIANLSAKRQLSVAKLSAKRIFSLAKRDFLVANGRMAADFSSPVVKHIFNSIQARFIVLSMFGRT